MKFLVPVVGGLVGLALAMKTEVGLGVAALLVGLGAGGALKLYFIR